VKRFSMRRRGLLPLIVIVLVAVGALIGTVAADNTPQLGLDLQGGFSVVLTAQQGASDDSVQKAMEIIRRRIDGLGVAEPEVTRQGKNVVIQLPGVKDRKKAQQIVGRTAKLQFRPVLIPTLPYDKANAAAPCAKAAEAVAGASSTTAPGTTAPGTTAPGTTAPGTTVPGQTTAPAGSTPSSAPSSSIAPGSTTTTVAGNQTGAPAGAALGESAAAVPRQADPPTTAPPTTAPPTTAPPSTAPPSTAPPSTAPPSTTAQSTTKPGASTSTPGGSTTTSMPAADGSVIFPDQEKTACLQLGPVGFEGNAVSGPKAELNPSTSEWRVTLSIRSGSKKAANALFNACNSGQPTCPPDRSDPGRAAIVLDGVVISSPAVQTQNLADGGSFEITGNFKQSDAKDLALVLRYGALPVEFERSAEQQVSATLGKDSLDAGLLAGVGGLVAVAVYMLLYYRGLGLVVILGLGVWSARMYSIICLLSARSGLALSLAGVTGIIVSVGTTVDSYVVYFERLKDEVKSGKTVRSSTERGFQRAFRTILTADVSSFIGAFLLYTLTVGPVRGFAFFLGLSVILDVVVAYMFTRPVVALLGRSRFFTEARFFGVARGLAQEPTAVPAVRVAK